MVLYMSITYKQSGVDIEAGDNFVEQIKQIASPVTKKGTIGLFGSVLEISELGLKNPVLVTGTDGVGTKLKLAHKLNTHNTIGIDLVAMCVNDILCHGAKPSMFLDYYASSKIDPQISVEIIKGIVEGCKLAGCSLSGGETAEMPGMYIGKDYDLAGFAIGFCERDNLYPKTNQMQEGDVLLGLPSSGFHSNGYSLVNKVCEVKNIDLNKIDKSLSQTKTIGQLLLEPTKIYVKEILPLLTQNSLVSIAHITGGGLYDNTMRVVKNGYDIEIFYDKIKKPPIMQYIQSIGEIEENEMKKVFNLGIGLVLIVKKDCEDFYLSSLQGSYVVGSVKLK